MQSNIFTATVSRLRSNISVQELIIDFKDQVKPKIAKGTTLQPQNLIKKFNTLQKRYSKNKANNSSMEWQESQRKLFLMFILAYCHLEFKKLNEISNTEWNDISICFHHKNILLMQYEARTYQKNSERVSWDHSEERLLEELIKSELNGKWSEISRVLYFKSEGEYYKTAKQCRQHWLNHMNGDIVKGDWTIDEDLIILTFVQKEGHHWSRVVEKLSRRRTEHMIKNRFTSLVNCAKKMLKKKKSIFDQQQIIVYLMKELKSNKADLEFMRNREEISDRAQSLSPMEQNIKSQKQQIICSFQKTELDLDQKMINQTLNNISIKQMNSMKTIDPSNQPHFNHSLHHSYSEPLINLNGSYDYPNLSGFEMGQSVYMLPQNQPCSYALKTLVNPMHFFIAGDSGQQENMGSMRDQNVGENSCFNKGGYYELAEQNRGCHQLQTIKNNTQQ